MGGDAPEAEAVRGYCAAVRGAVTDDGRPPPAASGLVLKGRLEAVVDSLDRGEELAPGDLGAWRQLRAGLERRQGVRAQGR